MGDDKKIWLTPAGAGIALVCFFLPWVEFSCGEMKQSISGSEIGGIFWVVFAAAALCFLAFFYFKNSDEVERARPIIILGSLVGLGILLYKYFDFKSGAQTGLQGLSQLSQMQGFQSQFGAQAQLPQMGFHIKYGGIGTIIGFVLLLLGGLTLGGGGTGRGSGRPSRKAVISYYQEPGKEDEQAKTPLYR
ncbi:MAG: hypothetical protein GX409_11960 [candidate division Zixibacteria bacterium]|nr:hypothetical protein [candidate division Zixibacteria bacterium]